MKNKYRLSVFLIISANLLNSNVFAETTTRTIKESIINSYSQTKKVVINLPYGVSINDTYTRIDNGRIISKSLNILTGDLTIEVGEGTSHEIFNEQKYPKAATDTITKDYKGDLPDYIKVESDGYSGSIPLYKTTLTSISKTVSGTAAVVEDFYWRCDKVGEVTPNKAYDPSKPESSTNLKNEYNGASWSGNHRNFDELAYAISPGWSGTPDYYGGISNISYKDNDGYSGEGSASRSEPAKKGDETPYSALYIATWQNNWTLPELYKRANHYSIMNRYNLSATVYKPVYEGQYKGTIYKGGNDDVYTYNITVSYNEDNLDIYEMHSTEWTNKDLDIKISSKSYFFNLFKLNTLYKYTNPSTFSVSTNGTYKFYVSDSNHGQRIRTQSIDITIKNIDKDNPYGTFSPNSRTSWDGDITVTFNPLDIGGSGVKRWRYCVSTNDGSSYGSYSNYYTSESKILLNVDGKNKIKVEIEDVAGNVAYSYSGSYYVDKTPPTLSFTPDGCDWRNTSINATWLGTDTASLVKGYKYRIKTNDGYTTTTSDWTSSSISNTSKVLDKDGIHEIEVDVVDNAGNSKTYLSKEFKVDKTAPTLKVNVESFIKDTFKEIPINLSDVKDNLVGVKSMELSLFKDFSKKVTVDYVNNTTSYDVLLPRYGLSFDQILYVRVTDLLGNNRTYTEKIYLDPLPPEIPNLIAPVDDILIVNSEKLSIEWDYEDPGSFKLLKTDLIFTNKENKTVTTLTIDGEDTFSYLDPALVVGVYDLTVKVYNTENKFTESTTSTQVRKNRFKVGGNIYSKEIIVQSNPIQFIQINLDAVEQDLPETTSTIKSYADVYIVLPEDNGTFNINNTKNTLKYDLNSSSDVFRIPGRKVNKLLVLVKMKSDDKEYSRITPWLDKISVSVK